MDVVFEEEALIICVVVVEKVEGNAASHHQNLGST